MRKEFGFLFLSSCALAGLVYFVVSTAPSSAQGPLPLPDLSDTAQATGIITPTIQADLHVSYDPISPQPLILGENYPYIRLWPAVKPPLAKPEGVDLDVTYISRTPRYNRYCIEYFEIQGARVPRLCPGTESEKHNPEPGEVVTFTAHIINKGTIASEDFAFAWYIDEQPMLTGTRTGIAPGEMVTETYQWVWSDGDHTVRFVADPENLIPEISERNNWVEDYTNAFSFQIGVSPYVYEAFNQVSNYIGSYSFEDWLQQQIITMNLRFEQAVYPLTPNGILDRVRIDSILVTDTENIPIAYPHIPFEYDGQWIFRVPPDDPNTPENESERAAEEYASTFAKAIDWGLIHELTHQLGIIDLYNLNHWPEDNLVLDKEGFPVEKGFYWHNGGLMGGGDTTPYNDGTFYSDHTARALNANRGYRRGYYGEYLYDVPLRNYLQILDNQGNPLPGANLYLYQNDKDRTTLIDAEPEITGTTDANGVFLLPNRSVDGGITTATGHTLRDNPFGVINLVGNNGRFLVQIVKGDQEEFHWLDITAFNLAYWEGHTESYTFTLKTHIAPDGAPSPPKSLRTKVEKGQVYLRWNPSNSPGVVGYNVYRATWMEYEFTRIVTGTYTTEHIDTSTRDDGPCHYAVTAVDINGFESALSNVVSIVWWMSPAGLVIDPKGKWLITDRHYQRLVTRYPNGERMMFLGGEHDYHWGLSDVAIDPHGYLYTVGTLQNEVKIRDPSGREIMKFGELGNGEGQFNKPMGIAYFGPGYGLSNQPSIVVADTGNNRIQVFDAISNFIGAYGGIGQLSNPKDVAVDVSGHIIVADTGNNRLQVLTFDGTDFTLLRTITADFLSPESVTTDSGNRIIVADTGNNRVKVLDEEGTLLAEYTQPNDGYTGDFLLPKGVAVDKLGRIIVSDVGNRRVVSIITPFPAVASVTPTSGPNDVSTPIVISGANFTPGLAVTLDSVSLAATYITSATLEAIVPPGLDVGIYSLKVTNPNGQYSLLTEAFTVTNPIPTIIEVIPDKATSETEIEVTILGTNFVPTPTVFMDSTPLTVTAVTTVTIGAIIPKGMPTGVYTLTVVNPGPGSPSGSLPNAFAIIEGYELYLPVVLKELL